MISKAKPKENKRHDEEYQGKESNHSHKPNGMSKKRRNMWKLQKKKEIK